MNHDAFEQEMIDTVNRHAEETSTSTNESTAAVKKSVFTKTDVMKLKLGVKCTALALITALLSVLAALCFIAVASATGYWAVALFFIAIVLLFWAIVFLYAQGIIHAERQGERK
jgi:ABC-type polysaccharide/polyol phosphate export permease